MECECKAAQAIAALWTDSLLRRNEVRESGSQGQHARLTSNKLRYVDAEAQRGSGVLGPLPRWLMMDSH